MDKRRIDFAVVGQEITFSMADPVPRGDTQQYLTAHFSVDEAWVGLSLQAVFGRKGRGFSPVTVSLNETMACDFPPSLLTAPDGGGTVYVRVGLIGTDTKGVRLTTGCAAVPVAPSCYVRGETPKDPPQDVYAKLLGAMGAKLDANQGAANAGKVLAIDENGEVVPMETPSGGGVAEEKDPTVPAWAKQPNKPAYTADEVGAISQDQLDSAVNQALAQAKESGAFDGAPGKEGAQGPQGDPYTLTETDKAEIVAAVIESLGGNPIFGYVDEDNNIIVQGDLADGTYSVKYEMENGNVVNIGDMVLDSNVYYSVTSTLTNCTINNSAKQIVEGGSYTATVTAKDGYELKSLAVTMGGSPVSVSGGSISIASVTGNIVITAVAEEVKVAEPVTVDIALTDGIRIGSDGGDRTQAGYCATPHIDLTAIPKPCTIHLTKALWCHAGAQTSTMVRVYAKNTAGSALVSDTTRTDVGSGYFTVVDNSGIGNDVTVTVTSDEVASIRFSGGWTISGVSDSNVSFAAANTKATMTYTPAS